VGRDQLGRVAAAQPAVCGGEGAGAACADRERRRWSGGAGAVHSHAGEGGGAAVDTRDDAGLERCRGWGRGTAAG
jgi:hypothetical protein